MTGQQQGRGLRIEVRGIQFGHQEIRDLIAAWLALGLAFTLFIGVREPLQFVQELPVQQLARVFGLSMMTVGTGFLLHELAHKVVAVRFGQVAAFRADYAMLGLAIASGFAGFLFAAPGAVYHRGYITDRENGLVAVAGPVTNLGLVVLFIPLFVFGPGFVAEIGRWGLLVNGFLAAFNMLPFGPLDGRTVLDWSRTVFGAVLGASVLVTLVCLLFVL